MENPFSAWIVDGLLRVASVTTEDGRTGYTLEHADAEPYNPHEREPDARIPANRIPTTRADPSSSKGEGRSRLARNAIPAAPAIEPPSTRKSAKWLALTRLPEYRPDGESQSLTSCMPIWGMPCWE